MKDELTLDTSNATYSDNIVSIMRDMAESKQNLLGDYWDKSFCNDAANEIERLQKVVDAALRFKNGAELSDSGLREALEEFEGNGSK